MRGGGGRSSKKHGHAFLYRGAERELLSAAREGIKRMPPVLRREGQFRGETTGMEERGVENPAKTNGIG